MDETVKPTFDALHEMGGHFLIPIAALALFCGCSASPEESPRPLPRAHAHNDYLHARPLLDALHQGFCSVEADIHLVGGQLLVAHDLEDVTPKRTLEFLYLKPLRERISKHDGRVFRNGPTFTLLIDIKSEAEPTYRKLHEVLGRYADLLTVYRIGSPVMPGAVTVIVSGNRPRELMASQPVRYAALDGRVSDLPTDPPRALIPLISDNWRNHFEWTGEGAIAETERLKLRGLVERAHGQGRRIRFWAVPDQPSVWQVLWEEGVDLINTDHLEGLSGFLRGR